MLILNKVPRNIWCPKNRRLPESKLISEVAFIIREFIERLLLGGCLWWLLHLACRLDFCLDALLFDWIPYHLILSIRSSLQESFIEQLSDFAVHFHGHDHILLHGLPSLLHSVVVYQLGIYLTLLSFLMFFFFLDLCFRPSSFCCGLEQMSTASFGDYTKIWGSVPE